MKYIASLLFFGVLMSACTKEETIISQEEKIEQSEAIQTRTEAEEFPSQTISLEMDAEEFHEVLETFREEHQTNDDYVQGLPNLEENTAVMSIVPFNDGPPTNPNDPFGALQVQCGVDGNNQSGRQACNAWAHNLMMNHGCCLLSYGYNGDGSCYSVTLDC